MADKNKTEEQVGLFVVAAIVAAVALWALATALTALAEFAEVFFLWAIRLFAIVGATTITVLFIIRYVYGLRYADRLVDILQTAVEAHYGIAAGEHRCLPGDAHRVITIENAETEEEDEDDER